MKLLVFAAVVSLLSLAGCGRSDREVIQDYCHGRVACGIDPDKSTAAIDACVEANLHPAGTPREQCLTTETAVCLGECVRAHGCAVFDVNDACSCQLKRYDCPE